MELTEEEKNEAIEKAIYNAYYEKQARLNMIAYKERLSQQKQFKRHTAEELKNWLENRPGFNIDKDNEAIIDKLCLYFSNDERASKVGINLQKGILLFGKVGVGKTLLLDVFRMNQKQSYQPVSCMDVEGTYARNGDDRNESNGELGLKKFFVDHILSAQNQFGQETMGYFFDDLGQENPATKYFGTERNVMLEVLSHRYKNKLFTSTHVTTNLNAKQLEERYTMRVADRMREMFNFLSFPPAAQSRRK